MANGSTFYEDNVQAAARLPVAQKPPPDATWSEAWSASRDMASAGPDTGVNQGRYEKAALGDIAAALKQKGYNVRPPEFYDIANAEHAYGLGIRDPITVDRHDRNQAFWAAWRDARGKFPDLLKSHHEIDDFAGVTDFAHQQRRIDMGEAGSVLSRVHGSANIASFAGGMVQGAINDPAIFAASLIPIGRGVTAGVGVGRAVLGAAAQDAAINAGFAVAQEPLVRIDASNLGEERTIGDSFASVAEQAAFGAAFGAGGTAIGRAGKAALAKSGASDYLHSRATIRAMQSATFDDRLLSATVRDLYNPHLIDAPGMTATERVAADVVDRHSDIREINPFVPGLESDAAHGVNLASATHALRSDRPLSARTVAPRGATNLNAGILQFLAGKGYPDAVARGIAAGIEAEGGLRTPVGGGYKGRAYGIGQWLGPRKAELFKRYGENPGLQDQLEFLHWELQGGDPGKGGKHVLAETSEEGALHKYITRFMRPKEGLETTSDLSRGMAALGRSGQLRPALSDVPHIVSRETGEAGDFESGEIYRVSAKGIEADPERFQYKSGGDQYGVSDRLQGVTHWDDSAADVVTLWQQQHDGQIFVADGHQRVGLAKRLIDQGHEADIPLLARVFREADGHSADSIMLRAAVTNIIKESGSALDAAKILRMAPDHPALAAIDRTRAFGRQAQGLSRLSSDATRLAKDGYIPEAQAAIVGHLARDADTHSGLMKVLHHAKPANLAQAELIVRDAMSAGHVREVQTNLFGKEEQLHSLYGDRAKVLEMALKKLDKDRKLHGLVAENVLSLEATGSTIAKDASAARAAHSATLQTLVAKLARMTDNPVNTRLSEAARSARESGRYGEAANEFVDALRAEPDLLITALRGDAGEGLSRADGYGDSGRAGTSEPGDRFAQDPASGGPAAELAALEAEGQATMFGPDPVAEAVLPAFDDPAGEAIKAQVAGIEHDLRASIARAPLDLKFDMGDGEMRSAQDVLGGLDAQDAITAKIEQCMTGKPAGGALAGGGA